MLQNGPIKIGPAEYACPFCTTIMNMKSHMEDHIRIHTGEKPFPCPLCDYAGTKKSNLKRHMLTLHA